MGLALTWLPLSLATLLPLAGAVLLGTLLEPLVGLGFMLLAAPLGAWENIALGSRLLDSGQLLLLLTLAAWLIQGLARGRVRLRWSPLLTGLVPFLALAALSLVGAPSLQAGWRELVKWLEIGLLLTVCLDLGLSARTASGPRWRWLLVVLLSAGLVQALIGLWQFGLRGAGPEHFRLPGGFYRAYGTFEQPNPFGGFIQLNACLAIGALLGSLFGAGRQLRARSGQPLWRRIGPPAWLWIGGLALAAALLVLALAASWSRGAWLGFLAGLGAMILMLPRRPWQGLGLFGATLILGALIGQSGLAPPQLTGRLTGWLADFRLEDGRVDVRGVDINDANFAVLERLAHWQVALDMARDHPWSGVGFGNYEAAYPQYALLNWPNALGHAHNYYLNLLAEVGWPGLAAYLLFWSVVLAQGITILRRAPWPERGVLLGLMAAWVALAAHHLLDNLYVNNMYLHLGVMLGLQQLLAIKAASTAATAGVDVLALPVPPGSEEAL